MYKYWSQIFVYDQFQYCNSSMATKQKEIADELRLIVKALGCQHSQQLEVSGASRLKQELLSCKCTFNGSVQRAILLLKIKINDFIQSHLHHYHQIVSQQQQALLKAIRKSVSALNNSIEQLLHQGLLTLYIELNEAKEESSSINSTKITQNLLKVMITSMDSLLRYYFVFQEYLIRNNTKVKPKQNSTYSLKTIPTLHSEGSSSNLDTHIDDQLIHEIQQEINQKPLSFLFQEEMRKQRKKINQSEQVCRICFQSVKLNNLQRHVNNCAKKNSLKLQLETKNQEIRQLQEKLKQKYQQSCEESVHEEIDEEFRKICKLVLHASKNTERKGNKRCSLIGVKSQKNISERIQKYIESYLEDFQENQILAQLLSNYRQRSLIEKHISNIEISSLFSDQHEDSSDLERPIQQKSIRRSNCKNHTALIVTRQKSIFCQQGNKKKGSDVDIPYASSQDQSQQLEEDQKLNQKQRIDNSLKKLQTKRSLSKKNQKDLSDEMECDFYVVKHYSSLHNITDKPEEDDLNSHVRLKDFEILQFLGQGAFGKVYMARRKETKDIYALKIIKISEDYSQKELLAIKNQHQIFKKIAGDHLVKAPFSFSEKSCHIFVLQFLPGGDLRKLLTDEVYFQEDKAKFYIAEIILAIQHLHKYGIIHRDLKPENLVIDRKGHLKLTDFGLSEFQVNKKLIQSRKQEEKAMQQAKSSRRKRRAAVYGVNKQKMQLIGTPDYIAPEIINQTSFSNYTIDWWSLGVMAYELIIGARPFSAQTIQQVIDNITNFSIEWPEVGEEEGMITADAKDFISKLLNKDFSQRLGANGAEQIKLHPFLSGIDWVNLKASSTLFLPRRLTKFSELVGKEQDKKLKKEIQMFMQEGKKGKNLHLQTFIRFDLLKSQTIENMQKKQEQTSKKLKRLKTLREISNEITITTDQ